MKDRFKGFLRQMSTMDYKYTKVSEEHEKLEQKYRLLRDFLTVYEASCDKIMTYEHGGKTYKNVMEALEVVGERVNLQAFKVNNIYEQASLVVEKMADIHASDALNKTASDYSKALGEIGHKKTIMNGKFEDQMMELQKIKSRTAFIDKQRNITKNIRFDLEKAYKNDPDGVKIPEDLKNSFQTHLTDTEKYMREFVENKDVIGVINGCVEAQKTFHSAALEALKNVK
ncbi:hypothetical protein LUQ84_002896 [Hamiltosporidium tvaerminnensis]|nr:hypothetical protein LUQ84_002896 [Hamiltosporidium tvaerminnensis]